MSNYKNKRKVYLSECNKVKVLKAVDSFTYYFVYNNNVIAEFNKDEKSNWILEHSQNYESITIGPSFKLKHVNDTWDNNLSFSLAQNKKIDFFTNELKIDDIDLIDLKRISSDQKKTNKLFNEKTKRLVKGKKLKSIGKKYVILDFELSGQGRFDNIIQVGAIKVINDNIVDTLNFYVKPPTPITEFVTKLTGITNSSIKDVYIKQKDALIIIKDFIEDFPIVGHNVYEVEMAILAHGYDKHLNQPIYNDYFCTMENIKHTEEYKKYHCSLSLKKLITTLEPEFIFLHHDAFEDCRATNKLVEIINHDKIKDDNVKKEIKKVQFDIEEMWKNRNDDFDY